MSRTAYLLLQKDQSRDFCEVWRLKYISGSNFSEFFFCTASHCAGLPGYRKRNRSHGLPNLSLCFKWVNVCVCLCLCVCVCVCVCACVCMCVWTTESDLVCDEWMGVVQKERKNAIERKRVRTCVCLCVKEREWVRVCFPCSSRLLHRERESIICFCKRMCYPLKWQRCGSQTSQLFTHKHTHTHTHTHTQTYTHIRMHAQTV